MNGLGRLLLGLALVVTGIVLGAYILHAYGKKFTRMEVWKVILLIVAFVLPLVVGFLLIALSMTFNGSEIKGNEDVKEGFSGVDEVEPSVPEKSEALPRVRPTGDVGDDSFTGVGEYDELPSASEFSEQHDTRFTDQVYQLY